MKNSRRSAFRSSIWSSTVSCREPKPAHDPLAAAIYAREQAALAAMPEALKALPCDQVALKPFDLVGLAALRQLLAPGACRAATNIEAPSRSTHPACPTWWTSIAADGHGLVMLMGKGGVGKTTLAAAIAVELAHRGLPVHLTTSDPAAHLAETLSGSLAEPHRQPDRPARGDRALSPACAGHQGRETRCTRPRACSKKTCARPAPRKSPCSRLSRGSSAKRARSSW